MKNYNYHVNIYTENGEIAVRTNDVKAALGTFLEFIESGHHCNLMNGNTGEVLAIANYSEEGDFVTEEVRLMILGFLL